MKEKVLFVIAAFGWFISLGQSDADLKVLDARSNGVYEHYQNSYVAPILTGKGYYVDYRGAENSPYFGSDDLEFGTLVYGGIMFKDIEIEYDLYTQEVVVQLETKNDTQLIIVDSDKVSDFSIKNYEFVNIRMDSVMNSGFYQLAYKGPDSRLLIKRTMEKDEEMSTQEITTEFIPKNEYFIKNQFGSFRVNSKKRLVKAYNNSAELLTILKKNSIRFSKSKIENGLITVLSLLDPKVAAN